MASFEGLADASLAAAMNVQRLISGQTKSLAEFDDFIRLLDSPLIKNSDYKLLTDARKLPIYRRAWDDTFGQSAPMPSSELLLQISQILRGAKDKSPKDTKDMQEIIDFCLALNRIFLEEDADIYDMAYRARVSHGSF